MNARLSTLSSMIGRGLGNGSPSQFRRSKCHALDPRQSLCRRQSCTGRLPCQITCMLYECHNASCQTWLLSYNDALPFLGRLYMLVNSRLTGQCTQPSSAIQSSDQLRCLWSAGDIPLGAAQGRSLGSGKRQYQSETCRLVALCIAALSA